MKFIRDIISEKRAQAEAGAAVSQDSRELSDLINRRLDASFDVKTEPRAPAPEPAAPSRPPLPRSLFAEEEPEDFEPLTEDDPYIREILNPSLASEDAVDDDTDLDDDFDDGLDEDDDLLAEAAASDAEDPHAGEAYGSAEADIRDLLAAEDVAAAPVPSQTPEADLDAECDAAGEDTAPVEDRQPIDPFADTGFASAKAEYPLLDEDMPQPAPMAKIADPAEPATAAPAAVTAAGWAGTMPRPSAEREVSKPPVPRARPDWDAPADTPPPQPSARAERRPEPDRAEAAPPVDVPAPAIGRATRRAGRVKTRLLGFNGPPAQSADPFAASGTPAAAAQSEFPVGWLAVVKGPGRGAAFTLFSGVAQIGRGQDQTIALDFGDNSISRENHAAVAYDGEQRKFYLGHGGKANLVRRNDRPVLSTEELKSGDLIRIGETTLRFVAFCDESFDWTEQRQGGMQHATVG